MEDVPKVERGATEIEHQKGLAVLDEVTLTGPHRFNSRGNHGPRKAGSCEKLAKTK